MSSTLRLEIVTPVATVFSEDVEMVTLPGVEGEIGILPQHVPLMTQMVPGEMVVRKNGQDRFLAVGEGAVWVLNQGNGSVSRIDPKTNKVVATIEAGVPGTGGDIAAGEGSVWVTSFDFPLSRIDPATNRVVQQFVGEGGDAVRVGLGSVWLSNGRAQNAWRIDPKRVEATVAEFH